jgi:hypothetical protein
LSAGAQAKVADSGNPQRDSAGVPTEKGDRNLDTGAKPPPRRSRGDMLRFLGLELDEEVPVPVIIPVPECIPVLECGNLTGAEMREEELRVLGALGNKPVVPVSTSVPELIIPVPVSVSVPVLECATVPVQNRTSMSVPVRKNTSVAAVLKPATCSGVPAAPVHKRALSVSISKSVIAALPKPAPVPMDVPDVYKPITINAIVGGDPNVMVLSAVEGGCDVCMAQVMQRVNVLCTSSTPLSTTSIHSTATITHASTVTSGSRGERRPRGSTPRGPPPNTRTAFSSPEPAHKVRETRAPVEKRGSAIRKQSEEFEEAGLVSERPRKKRVSKRVPAQEPKPPGPKPAVPPPKRAPAARIPLVAPPIPLALQNLVPVGTLASEEFRETRQNLQASGEGPQPEPAEVIRMRALAAKVGPELTGTLNRLGTERERVAYMRMLETASGNSLRGPAEFRDGSQYFYFCFFCSVRAV